MPIKKPCPQCRSMGGDTSGDNLNVYDDGGEHCFACGHHVNSYGEPELPQSVGFLSGEYKDIPERRLTALTCSHFDYEVDAEERHIANYYNDKDEPCGQKIRCPDKTFFNVGKISTALFGKQQYQPTKNLFITVTEGEIDTLSIAETQGIQYPVVSVPDGADGAKNTIKANLKYLSGFKHVVLCFDNDVPGKRAAEECAKLFEPGFARIAKLPLKDANEMLVAGRGSEITKGLFNAQPYRPDNIIKLSEITLDDIKKSLQPGIDICFPKLNAMLNGLRKQSLYTLVARAKVGKTTLTKELVLDLVNKGITVGVLYLEEDAVGEASSLVAMESNIPQHKIIEHITGDTMEKIMNQKKFNDKLSSYEDKGLYLYNHKGVIDIDSVYNAVNYMIKGLDCEVIVLDNVSISVAGTDANANERKLIDNMVFRLVQLINNTKCIILTVVHVNQQGEGNDTIQRKDVFGSGAFLKFSRALIALDRTEDNCVQLSVLGNRATGIEGKADLLRFNRSTGRLNIIEEVV
jgi:twinkle protein